VAQVFHGTYVQDGARVLIYTAGRSAPDTGEVSGRTLTVRRLLPLAAQQPSLVVMTYER
jgi:hypothetical protein